MNLEDHIEESVARIRTLPENEQVREIVEILEAVPKEGLETVITYFRMTKEERSVAA